VTTSVKDAASEAELSERTVYRYLSEREFRAALRRRQDEVLSSVTAALVGAAEEAVETLRAVMLDESESGSVRVRAARELLRAMRRSVELEALADRVRLLEESVGRES